MSMIPNPKKNVTIDFTMNEIKSALAKIPQYFGNKYTLEKKNDLLNQFTFGALEFLSMGVFIDINLNYVTESKTDIIVEIRRKIGAFDQWVEVQKANQHIDTLFTGLSVLLAKVRQTNAENSLSVNVENPSEVIKFDLTWQAIKKHINTFSNLYPNAYSLISTDDESEIFLRRKSQSGDEHYLDIDAILKITIGLVESSSVEIKFLITNENNKIETQGELNRNNQILKITINLINKVINDLKNKITQAEKEVVNVSKWKLGRSKETKQMQIDQQQKIVNELKQQLKE